MADPIGLRRLNPYTPGAAAMPPAMTGRDDLVARFQEHLLAREQGGSSEYLIISGQRGMGKTVLLAGFRDLATHRGWLSVRLEATEEGPFLASLAVEIHDVVEDAEPRPNILKRATRALDELTVGVGVGPARAELKAKRTAPSPAVDVPVARLIGALGAAARDSKVGAAILLDEIQAIEPFAIKAIARAFQAAEADRLPLVLAGCGLPNTPDHLRDAVSYAERYRFVELQPLVPAAVRAALEAPATKLGVHYEQAALDLLVAAAEGYPYLVQLIGRNAWEAAAGGDIITMAHAQAAVVDAQTDMTELLRRRWRAASAGEQKYLGAMAALGPGPIASGDIARKLDTTAQALSTVRQRLIDKGVVASAGPREVDFTLPGFRTFVLGEVEERPELPPPHQTSALPLPPPGPDL